MKVVHTQTEKKPTKTTWSDRNRERETPHPSIAGTMCHGTVPIGPPWYCPPHPTTPSDPVSLPPTLWSYLPAAPGRTFFSGIQRDILLRTKPFLLFYNSSPLAGARQWVQCNKNNPSPTTAMTGNADTSASCTYSRCPCMVTHRLHTNEMARKKDFKVLSFCCYYNQILLHNLLFWNHLLR